jgi:hypothetical protein
MQNNLCQSNAVSGFSSQDKKVFNNMLELYDNKEYKKALEKSDIILEKYHYHAEGRAFKALILNCLKRGAEAFELIK